jgi:hypothetical protein
MREVFMGLLREVKGDAESTDSEEEVTIKVGDKKVTVKVQDEASQPSKRQLLVE